MMVYPKCFLMACSLAASATVLAAPRLVLQITVHELRGTGGQAKVFAISGKDRGVLAMAVEGLRASSPY